jgi:hypothetical protein
MTETDELIERLAAGVAPVKRLRPPLVRAAAWLLFALATIAALTLLLGVRPDWSVRIREPVFELGMLASVATGALAALTAFLVSLPDRSRLWLMLPVPAACVWVSTIGLGCLTAWVPVDGAAMTSHEVLQCFATLLLSSLPLSMLMFWMLRHAAVLRPSGAVLSAGLAAGALTATALSVVHRFDASILILVWNLGAAGLVLAVDAAVGGVVIWGFHTRPPAAV